MTAAVTLVLLAVLSAADAPVVLEFTTLNCPACRQVDPVVRGLASEGLPIRQLDAKANRKLVEQFHIRAYPTFVCVSGQRELGRIEGAVSRERLIGLLKPAATLESRLQTESSKPPEGGIPTRQRQDLLVRGQSPEASAAPPARLEAATFLAGTVRLRVQDLNGNGAGVGSGTIIDTHFNEEAKAEEALVITCGHLFRDSQGKGKITVDLFVGGQTRSVEGQLLDFDDKKDIALVSIWPGAKIARVQVAPQGYVSRPQDPVFTVGCSEGREPTVQESRVNAINRFVGKPNITIAGTPANGRSGGGLFSAEGLLIGVCNAANVEDQEGLYASLPTVHWQLDKFNLQAIYERASPSVIPASAVETGAVSENQPATRPAPFHLAAEQNPAGVPELSREMPRSVPLAEENGPLTDDDREVVFIVRSKKRPENQSEIYVVDHVSPELLSRITTAARSSAQARAAGRQSQPASRLALQNRATEQPVVRGQMK